MTSPPIVRADGPALARAAALLRAGRLVAFPTETVYGLGADATSDTAVAAVYAAKGRPTFNPLIVHGADAESLRRLVRFDDRADLLVARLWPGPLTLVLPRQPNCPVSLLAGAGLDTLAVRMPAREDTRDLIRLFDRPIVGPSANPSGRVSPTTAAHVADDFDDTVLALILDGGPCPVGLESTVLDLSRPQAALLRPGGMTLAEIEAMIGPVALPDSDPEQPMRSPGMLASHYAPSLPLRLDAIDVRADEALLAFGARVPPGAATMLNLSASGDPMEAATNLFAMLRALDRPDLAGIAVMSVPDAGLGQAINDRLRRAAAPRG